MKLPKAAFVEVMIGFEVTQSFGIFPLSQIIDFFSEVLNFPADDPHKIASKLRSLKCNTIKFDEIREAFRGRT